MAKLFVFILFAVIFTYFTIYNMTGEFPDIPYLDFI